MGRNVKDAQFITTKALPAAGASNQSTAFDLGTRSGYLPEGIDAQIILPATPSLVDTKSVTLTVQDSADNASFAAIASIATVVVTGTGGAGASAVTRTFRLPDSTRRYVRVNQAVDGSGGDNTAVSTTFQLLF